MNTSHVDRRLRAPRCPRRAEQLPPRARYIMVVITIKYMFDTILLIIVLMIMIMTLLIRPVPLYDTDTAPRARTASGLAASPRARRPGRNFIQPVYYQFIQRFTLSTQPFRTLRRISNNSRTSTDSLFAAGAAAWPAALVGNSGETRHAQKINNSYCYRLIAIIY